MDIVVCVKEVAASDATIHVRDDAPTIETSGVTFIVNPFDEIAIAAALRLREELGGEVTVVSLGPPRATEAIRTCLALGCDRAIHLKDEAFEGGDSFATAKVLAKALSGLNADIIFAGTQAVDSDCGAVFIELAEMLGLPHVDAATQIEVASDGRSAVCHREVEGAEELIETSLPAVIGAQKGLAEPSYPSLKGIMAARKKPIEEKDATAVGLSPEEVGSTGSLLVPLSLCLAPERPSGRILDCEVPEAAREVMRLLHEEAKVL